MTATEVPDRLLAARRYVDGFPELRLVDDIAPVGTDGLWSFAVAVTLEVPAASLLPTTTRWRIVLSAAYPWGKLDAFPDATQGVTDTFPHQLCNLPPRPRTPRWRTGLICVRSPSFIFNRVHLGSEPLGSAVRMRWFLGRVLMWLNAAARDALFSEGDPFELPDFTSEGPAVVCSESEETLGHWISKMPQFGLADMCHLGDSGQESTYAIRAFRDVKDQVLVRVPWGDWIEAKPISTKAVWIRLPCTPFLKPYQAPMTWGDMRCCFREMGKPFDGTMRRALQPIRDGHPHLAIFGFPIPEKIGGDAAMMHWQACELPPLAYGTNTRRGFRNNAVGYWRQDCYEAFRCTGRISWRQSRNWHMDQLTGRGALHKTVRTGRIGIIGAGAVGSVLSELLVRAGVQHLRLVDKDRVEAGNLVRHTMTLADVGKNKAEAVAERLRRLSPHVSVTIAGTAFPVASGATSELLTSCDILIDCSASDEVAHALEEPPWNEAGLRASISLGFGAKRCYVYLASAGCFSLRDLQSKGSPWFTIDKEELASEDLPAEAVGCWHPLYPARIDRVWLMTSLAVREIERALQHPPAVPLLIVYEQADGESDEAAVVRRVV